MSAEFIPVAKYSVAAVVLSKKTYFSGWEKRISPVDLVLGWGSLADKENIKKIKINQSDRWYSYRILEGEKLLKDDEVIFNSSNNHIIPADDNLKKALKRIKKGETIYLEGYLVNVKGKYLENSVFWVTSTKRNDTGNSSYEIFYVTKIKTRDKIYD